jgi:hypothetical protein
MKYPLLLMGMIFWGSAAFAEPGRMRLSLQEAERRAVAASSP